MGPLVKSFGTAPVVRNAESYVTWQVYADRGAVQTTFERIQISLICSLAKSPVLPSNTSTSRAKRSILAMSSRRR